METTTMNGFKFRTLIFLLICTQIGKTKDPFDTWTWRNPQPTGNILYGLAYGNGQFVAVGGAGTIVTSTDGTNWVLRESGSRYSFYGGVIYANGQFVAVSDPGTIVTSVDGRTGWGSSRPQLI